MQDFAGSGDLVGVLECLLEQAGVLNDAGRMLTQSLQQATFGQREHPLAAALPDFGLAQHLAPRHDGHDGCRADAIALHFGALGRGQARIIQLFFEHNQPGD